MVIHAQQIQHTDQSTHNNVRMLQC